MDPVNRGEIDFPMLLPRRAHGLELRRYEFCDDAVGMRYPAEGAFTSTDHNQLPRSRSDCRFRLPQRIIDERVQYDEAHFVIQALEAAECVEHTIAPEEIIGGDRK